MNDAPHGPSAAPLPPLFLFDTLCDLEQLHGLVMAAEMVADQIDNDPEHPGRAWITTEDEKVLASVLRATRLLAAQLVSKVDEVA